MYSTLLYIYLFLTPVSVFLFTFANSPNIVYEKSRDIVILCPVYYEFQKFPYNSKEIKYPFYFLCSAELHQNGHSLVTILLTLLVSQTHRSASIKLLPS